MRAKFIQRLAKGVARFLEHAHQIYWLENRPRGLSVYFFLFGKSDEVLASLIPSRMELQAENPDPERELRLVFFTDVARVSRELLVKDHYVVGMDWLPGKHPGRCLQWLTGMTKLQMSIMPPVAVFISPDFMRTFARPTQFMRQLRELLKRHRMAPEFSTPSIITSEATLGSSDLIDWQLRLQPKGVPGGGFDLFYYGHPGYFDYAEYVGDALRRSQPLGWRLAALDGRARNQEAKPPIYVWLDGTLPCREILLNLERLPNRDAYGDIFFRATHEDLRPGTAAEAVQDMHPLLDRIRRRAGLVITDGSAPLLPLLGADAAVALVRNATRSATALVRNSYFLGQDRWPVFETIGELCGALERGPLDAFWKPYAGRRCTLEEGDAGTFQDGFIEKIYRPLVRFSAELR